MTYMMNMNSFLREVLGPTQLFISIYFLFIRSSLAFSDTVLIVPSPLGTEAGTGGRLEKFVNSTDFLDSEKNSDSKNSEAGWVLENND